LGLKFSGPRVLGDATERAAFTQDLRERGYFLALTHREDGDRMVRAAEAIERLVEAVRALAVGT
jgi:hypothetical protein